jgi:hypothetical protein
MKRVMLHLWALLALALTPIAAHAQIDPAARALALKSAKPVDSIIRSGLGFSSTLLSAGRAIYSTSPEYIDSSAIVILSDSTGIQPSTTTGWPYALARTYAAAYPTAAIMVKTWNATNEEYDAWDNITANIDRYLDLTADDGTPRARFSDRTQWGSYTDLDVRIDVAPASWTPTTSRAIFAQWGGSPLNGHRLLIRTDGKLELDFTTDGSTTTSILSSAATGFTNGVRKIVRVTRLGSTGAVNFYTRDPSSSTWVQLGSANVAGATGTIFSPARDFEIGCSGGSNCLVGRYYGIEYRAAIGDGKIVNPQPIETWFTNENVTPLRGSPTVYIYNGSRSGADYTYLTDATRGPKMVPLIHIPTIGIINDGLNESATATLTSLFPIYDGFKTLFTSRAPGSQTVALTQNPRTGVNSEPVRRRQNILRAWGLKNQVPVIDTAAAYLLDPNQIVGNLQGDGLHPNSSGVAVETAPIAARLVF